MNDLTQIEENKLARFRKYENLHIVFWLVKDICWCLSWKLVGLSMIAPTLAVGIFLTWVFRGNATERAHNIAVIFWIVANSYWMISEFGGFDEKVIWQGIEGKVFAVIPFSIGILVLMHHYLALPAMRYFGKKVPGLPV